MASSGVMASPCLALEAIKMIVVSEDFKVPSNPAKSATETAQKLLEWVALSDGNLKTLSCFSEKLVELFEYCFVQNRKTVKLDYVWREFHTLRTSDSFKEIWETFLQNTVSCAALPTFFQFVSYEMFKVLMKAKLHVPSSVQDQASPLTIEEQNALRYISGYVCRKVQREIKSSSIPHKDAMVLFLCELIDNELEDEEQESEKWIRAIDRGGLWHVSENTYRIFFLWKRKSEKS